MAAQTLNIKRGDTAPQFRAQCRDGTIPVTLTTALSAKFLMKKASSTVVSGTMVIEDQTTNPGWVHRAWGSNDTAVEGLYSAEVEVTWSDGTVQTYPCDEYTYIRVLADLG